MNVEDTEVLLDRERETWTIRKLIADVEQRRSGLLVIDGGAGTGKTALLNHLVGLARQGTAQVLFASGSRRAPQRPYDTLRELFEPAQIELSILNSAAPTGAEPTIWFQHGLGFRTTEPRSLDEDFAALCVATLNLTEQRPLILVIDDLQWVDSQSLSWLVYLARRSAGSALLIATTMTSGEPAVDNSLIDGLRETLTCVTMHPEPLSAGAVRQLVESRRRMPADDPFIAACMEVTRGNAGLVAELCRLLTAEGIAPTAAAVPALAGLHSPRIADYVARRLHRLAPHTLDVARAVTVLGDEVAIELVADLCSLEESVCSDAVATLVEFGLLQGATTVSFADAIIGRSLYHRLSARERRRLHGTAARLLAERGAHSPRQLAEHLLALGTTTDPEAVDLLCKAAVSLAAAGELDLSIACLERAIHGSLSPGHRARLALQLGIALGPHDVRDSIRHLRHAEAVIVGKQSRATVAWHLATGLAVQGDFPAAVEVLDGHLAAMDTPDEDLSGYRHLLSMVDGKPLAADDAGDPVEEASPVGAAQGIITAIQLTWRGHDRNRAVALADQFLLSGELAAASAIVLPFALLPLFYADRLDLVERHLTDAEREGRPLLATEVGTLRAQVALRRGSLANAETHARAVLADVARGLPAPVTFHHLGTMIEVLLARGEDDEASAMLSEARLLYQLPEEWRCHHLLVARGRLRIARGDLHAGLGDLLAAGQRLISMGVVNPAVSWWDTESVLALVQLGHTAQAATLAKTQLSITREWAAQVAVGRSLRMLGSAESDPAVRLKIMKDAADILTESGAELELGTTLFDLGRAQVLTGQQQEARESLRRGLDLAQRCGAAVLAEKAHAELVKSGARPRRRAQSGRDALTPTEERIARMVAERKTNREIAQELFVSLRTIELHLTNIYRKLRIAGRSGLAVAMDRSA